MGRGWALLLGIQLPSFPPRPKANSATFPSKKRKERKKALRASRRNALTQRRQEFERNLGIEKRDFGAIEYMLRRGQRQLEIYEDPGIRDIHR